MSGCRSPIDTTLSIAAAGVLLLIGCGGSRSVTPTSPTPPVPTAPGGPNFSVTGFVTDALTGSPIPGASVKLNNGFSGIPVSGDDGRFAGSIPGAAAISVELSHPGYVTRKTFISAFGPPQAFSLIPSTFDLAPFDTALRPAHIGLRRWMSAPALVVMTREIEYPGDGPSVESALVLDRDVAEWELTPLVTDLREGFMLLTDGRLGDFTSVTRESPIPGTRVPLRREGAIVVARTKDLLGLAHFGGATRTTVDNHVIISALIELDSGLDASAHPLRALLRKHEMGHAVGFYHVYIDSLMNPDLRYTRPTDWDIHAARIAYQRPPGNQSPDVDPDPTLGPAFAPLVWRRLISIAPQGARSVGFPFD
jgi:hypothetical protein